MLHFLGFAARLAGGLLGFGFCFFSFLTSDFAGFSRRLFYAEYASVLERKGNVD